MHQWISLKFNLKQKVWLATYTPTQDLARANKPRLVPHVLFDEDTLPNIRGVWNGQNRDGPLVKCAFHLFVESDPY